MPDFAAGLSSMCGIAACTVDEISLLWNSPDLLLVPLC